MKECYRCTVSSSSCSCLWRDMCYMSWCFVQNVFVLCKSLEPMVHQTVLSETDIKLRSPVYNLWVHVKEPLVVGNREEQPGYGATRAKNYSARPPVYYHTLLLLSSSSSFPPNTIQYKHHTCDFVISHGGKGGKLGVTLICGWPGTRYKCKSQMRVK